MPEDGDTPETFAKRLVDGARSGSHACMATIGQVRRNADGGDDQAKETLDAIREYIAAHPVEAS